MTEDLSKKEHQNQYGKEKSCSDSNDITLYSTTVTDSIGEKDLTEEEKNERCDYYCFNAPDCTQNHCRNAKCLLLFLCLAAFSQNLLCNGFVNGVITSLERRYKFSSSDTGILSAIYDIVGIFLLMPVGYIGGNWGRKSRWVALGMVMLALGSLVFSLPQAFSGKYEYFVPNVTSCVRNTNSSGYDPCRLRLDGERMTLSNYKWVFWFAQVLNGIGTTPMYTLATVMLFESLTNENSAMYIGIYESMSLLGPALGFIISGLFLNIYVDVGEPHPGLTVDNQSVWVGAWWIGFVISAITCLLSAILMFGFPKELPGAKEIRENRPKEAYRSDDTTENMELPKGFKQYGSFMRSLFKNPSYICLCLATSAEFFIVGGYATFGAKAMEVVFALKPSIASIIVGLLVAVGGSFGVFLGGLVIKLAKLSLLNIMKGGIIICACTLPFVLIFLLKCDTPQFSGIPQNNNINLDLSCNVNCLCSKDYTAYNPVCIGGNVSHFSPCFAGCTNSYKSVNETIYTNCTCSNNDLSSTYLEAKTGSCLSDDCPSFYIFVICLGIIIFLTFSLVTPLVVTTLRVVEPEEQPLSLGIKLIFARVFGSVPGPIIFGLLFDVTCLLWTEDCGQKGNCAFYDEAMVRYVFLGATGIAKCLSLIFIILAYYFYRSRNKYTQSTNL